MFNKFNYIFNKSNTCAVTALEKSWCKEYSSPVDSPQKSYRTLMYYIFSCLIKLHLPIVAFCVVIPMTLPLHLALLLCECSRAWSIGTELDACGDWWTSKSPTKHFWWNIGNFSSSFKQSSKYNGTQRSNEKNKGIPLCTADKWSDQSFAPNECVKSRKTGTVLSRKTLLYWNDLDFCDSSQSSCALNSLTGYMPWFYLLATLLLFKLSFVAADWNSLL